MVLILGGHAADAIQRRFSFCYVVRRLNAAAEDCYLPKNSGCQRLVWQEKTNNLEKMEKKSSSTNTPVSSLCFLSIKTMSFLLSSFHAFFNLCVYSTMGGQSINKE